LLACLDFKITCLIHGGVNAVLRIRFRQPGSRLDDAYEIISVTPGELAILYGRCKDAADFRTQRLIVSLHACHGPWLRLPRGG
jgi:hypothetical protein